MGSGKEASADNAIGMKRLTHAEVCSNGGHARAKSLTKAQRTAIARKAAQARWRAAAKKSKP